MLLRRVSSGADCILLAGDINNEFNSHVSDGATVGPHVTPSEAPDARILWVAAWISELGMRAHTTFL